MDISIMSADISTTAKCIYACISCFADSNRECYPTRATLIKMTRLNPTTFDKHRYTLPLSKYKLSMLRRVSLRSSISIISRIWRTTTI